MSHMSRALPKEQLLELRQHGVAGTLLRREVAGPEPVHCIWGLRPNTEYLGRPLENIWTTLELWISSYQCCPREKGGCILQDR